MADHHVYHQMLGRDQALSIEGVSEVESGRGRGAGAELFLTKLSFVQIAMSDRLEDKAALRVAG